MLFTRTSRARVETEGKVHSALLLICTLQGLQVGCEAITHGDYDYEYVSDAVITVQYYGFF